MAAKNTESIVTELRDTMAQNRVVIGTEKTFKEMRHNKLEKVFITVNAPREVKEDLQHYAGLTSLTLQELTQTNEELGVICKKPFSISIVGVMKE